MPLQCIRHRVAKCFEHQKHEEHDKKKYRKSSVSIEIDCCSSHSFTFFHRIAILESFAYEIWIRKEFPRRMRKALDHALLTCEQMAPFKCLLCVRFCYRTSYACV